jgi:hypothetical protein
VNLTTLLKAILDHLFMCVCACVMYCPEPWTVSRPLRVGGSL